MNRVVFVFPGQGEHWRGMGAALLEREPVFAEAVRECDAALSSLADWSVTDALSGGRSLDRIEVIQPALFAFQVGMARLWESRGVAPFAVVGHSLGEVAAAHVAGALTLSDAVRVVSTRSRLYSRLSGTGAMALVGMGWDDTAAVVAEQAGELCLAAANAPGSTVVSGAGDAISVLIERLRWEDVFCRRIDSDVAGHSHHVEPLLAELTAQLATLRPTTPNTALWSTVTGRPGTPDAAYWARNLREPVLFWPVVRDLLAAGHDTFIEISPHPTLLPGLRDVPARYLSSMHRDNPDTFAESLADLAAVAVSGSGVLGDHQVEGQPVYPAAGYVSLALAEADHLADVRFDSPLLLDERRYLRTRRHAADLSLTCGPTVHATARIATPPTVHPVDLGHLRGRCHTELDATEIYRAFERRGMEYGPSFRKIEAAHLGDREGLVRLGEPGTAAGSPSKVGIPLLDACLQAGVAVLDDLEDLLLPERIAQVSLLGNTDSARWVHVRRSAAGPLAEYDADLYTDDGEIVLSLRGIGLRRITRARETDGWLYTPHWQPVEPGDGEPFDGVVHRVVTGVTARDAVRDLLREIHELIAQPDPPRLWVVTSLAQAVEPDDTVDPAAAAVWGLARTLRHEHPELRCTLVDIDGGGLPDLWRLPEENEVAIRSGRSFALRLRNRPAVPSGPHRLVQSVQRDIATQSLRPEPVGSVGPGEVRIRVEAAGLNFNDVLRAMGMLGEQAEPLRFGLECTGVVTETGSDVSTVDVGTRVLAIATEIGAMASHMTVDARLAVPLPDGVNLVDAATLPVAYVTAIYGMEKLAGLRPGERVLIHAAAGGVGQAAVHLARRAGAEILATAGTEHKRAWLTAQGITHIFDSRSLDFADEVLAATGGAGVDMVVNSLAGEAIEAGLRTLAPFGRFVELGKIDIADDRPLRLGPFARSLSFHAVEVFSLARLRPDVVGEMLRQTVAAVAEGTLKPLPATVFPATDAPAAFRRMQSARHIGKLVVTFGSSPIRADGTYLVTGGLSGLGLAAAEKLAACGARHLALLGRGAPTPRSADRIAALTQSGTDVTVLRADVADEESLAGALAELRARGRPLRGVLHAAGVLRDRTLAAAEWDEFEDVLRPKTTGTRNLHHLTANDPLDLFVLFSSVAGLLGSGGQGGYAAANAYLDGFAHWRRAQGMPATTVNWGPWAETGLAARDDRAGRLAQRGMGGITTSAGLDMLMALLAERPTQVAVVPLDARTWFANNPGQDRWSVYTDFHAEGSTTDRMRFASADELRQALRSWVGVVIRTPAATLDVRVPLNRLGLDSLMAVELRNLVETKAGVRMSAAAFLDGPSITELAERIFPQLANTAEVTASADSVTASLDELSDLQVDALLDKILNEHPGGVA